MRSTAQLNLAYRQPPVLCVYFDAHRLLEQNIMIVTMIVISVSPLTYFSHVPSELLLSLRATRLGLERLIYECNIFEDGKSFCISSVKHFLHCCRVPVKHAPNIRNGLKPSHTHTVCWYEQVKLSTWVTKHPAESMQRDLFASQLCHFST